ncbi:unnamed protein product [Protopolystoma xenopodis]|uniref:Uncharacterized protein n=1 Tax=Protopolystoma xenopodis TaxID=117903 RepID=A0A3S5AE39_9PLAT|nr:unnamed protein product [Protopolystoma xenopodis]
MKPSGARKTPGTFSGLSIFSTHFHRMLVLTSTTDKMHSNDLYRERKYGVESPSWVKADYKQKMHMTRSGEEPFQPGVQNNIETRLMKVLLVITCLIISTGPVSLKPDYRQRCMYTKMS